ncbi:MAG: nitroreductase family protein [Coriobacteriales bacterium]|jgi:nitroreductase|nr:nitroreductase family protein [Coriobacteriales bacterium]
MSDFAQLAKRRYSLRAFKPDAVPQEMIDALLEMALVAPTAHNNQPQRIKVLRSTQELTLVDEFTPCRFGAPLVFVVCFARTAAWRRSFDGAHSGVVDASIVTTHLMLAAADLGLGSVWVMYFDPAKAAELLGLSENLEPVAVLPVGFAQDDARPSEFHARSLALSDILL